jgi:hypothetical protein
MKLFYKILIIGVIVFISGIILELFIRTMSGDIIELRSSEPVLVTIVLLSSGLIIIGGSFMYLWFGKKK